MFLYGSIGIIAVLLVLFAGERLKNETRLEYESKGYNWSKVILYSNLISIIAGLFVALCLHLLDAPKEINPYIVPAATTISTYVLVQSFFTDFRILKINRKILRVSYFVMYLFALYNVFFVEMFEHNKNGLWIFTGVIILIFILSPIGASDVRMIAVSLPYIVSLGGVDAIFIFAVSLIFVAIGMEIKNRIQDNEQWKEMKENNMELYKSMNKLAWYKVTRNVIHKSKTKEQQATPVGPFMILAFVLYLIVYPFLIV